MLRYGRIKFDESRRVCANCEHFVIDDNPHNGWGYCKIGKSDGLFMNHTKHGRYMARHTNGRYYTQTACKVRFKNIHKGEDDMMEMDARTTAAVLDNLLNHGKFNIVTRNAIENAVVHLRNSEQVVRCKDCRFYVKEVFKSGYCVHLENDINDSWFCADGEKEEEQP